MNAPATPGMLQALPAEHRYRHRHRHRHRHRLMSVAREVSFPVGTRLFDEGGRADRFWTIRTGSVALDMRVPGRRSVVIESLGHNEQCEEDPALGASVARWVGDILAHRLRSARPRLLDVYAPSGSGSLL